MESITRGTVEFKIGIIAGREPVARMMRSKETLSRPPAFEIAECLSSKAARPCMYSTLRCFESRPGRRSAFTTFLFHDRSVPGLFWDRHIRFPNWALAGFIDQLGHVEQSFGRNASAIQTDSAWIRLRIDECDFHSQIGGQKRCSIAPGPPPTTAICKFEVSVISKRKGINHGGHEVSRRTFLISLV